MIPKNIFIASLAIASFQVLGCATPFSKPAPMEKAVETAGPAAAALPKGTRGDEGVTPSVMPARQATDFDHRAQIEERWGLCSLGIRLTANKFLLDFRYRITDKEKAVSLFTEKKNRPYLIDEATGALLTIPELHKIGALRTSTKNLDSNKVGFILFANPGRLVKEGGKVTLVMGDLKIRSLVVE